MKTILVVEDNEDIGEFLMMALKMETGCRCLLARDGFQAMEQVTMLAPDFLLVDYQLPNMNGLEFYDHLREREEFQHVPVLFISANLPASELEKRRICAIQKPFEVEELLRKVRTILREP